MELWNFFLTNFLLYFQDNSNIVFVFMEDKFFWSSGICPWQIATHTLIVSLFLRLAFNLFTAFLKIFWGQVLMGTKSYGNNHSISFFFGTYKFPEIQAWLISIEKLFLIFCFCFASLHMSYNGWWIERSPAPNSYDA